MCMDCGSSSSAFLAGPTSWFETTNHLDGGTRPSRELLGKAHEQSARDRIPCWNMKTRPSLSLKEVADGRQGLVSDYSRRRNRDGWGRWRVPAAGRPPSHFCRPGEAARTGVGS